jgi:cysteinyl-tRNA synthetase
MITESLGYQIDISCGGIDNLYRHHDYTIAVIESLSGKEYANYYLHGEHLIVDGKPMSKSLGNILYPEDIIARGCQVRQLRLFLFHTHYRRKLKLTENNLKKNAEYLSSIRRLIDQLLRNPRGGEGNEGEPFERISNMRCEFEKQMNDDLSAGLAMDAVYRCLQEIRRDCAPLGESAARALRAELARIDTVLQVLL